MRADDARGRRPATPARAGRPARAPSGRPGDPGPVAPSPDAEIALAETFRVLGDPTRLRLARALAGGERSVGDLALLVGVSASAVSHSLRALRQLRLVTVRKVGKCAYYRLGAAHVTALLADGFRLVGGAAAPVGGLPPGATALGAKAAEARS